jgi:hypothetical protein
LAARESSGRVYRDDRERKRASGATENSDAGRITIASHAFAALVRPVLSVLFLALALVICVPDAVAGSALLVESECGPLTRSQARPRVDVGATVLRKSTPRRLDVVLSAASQRVQGKARLLLANGRRVDAIAAGEYFCLAPRRSDVNPSRYRATDDASSTTRHIRGCAL